MPRRPITVERPEGDLYERAMLENARAQAAQNQADIAYIAMMADVDLFPEGQSREEDNGL